MGDEFEDPLVGALFCGEVSCPVENVSSINPDCVVPYEGDLDDFCASVRLGIITKVLVVIGVLLYMLGVGCAIDLDKAKHAIRKGPRPLFVAFFCQTVLNPMLMFGLIAVFGKDFPMPIRIMAILIASSAGGQGSNMMAFLARGNVEISVAATVFSTTMAFATMPLYVFLGTEVFWKEEGTDLKIDFLSIFAAAASSTALPIIGVWIKYKWSERLALLISIWGTLIGITLQVLTALLYLFDPLFVAGLKTLGVEIWICAFLLNIGGLAIGYTASRAAGFTKDLHRTLAFETGSQNVAIPLGIVTISFGSGPVSTLFVPFLGAYLIGGIPVNYSMILFWRYCDPVRPEDLPHLQTDSDDNEKQDENIIVPSTESESLNEDEDEPTAL